MRGSTAAALACVLLLGACAAPTAPAPPGAQVDVQRLATAVVPGRSTRAGVLAALGPTRAVAFDSGYEAWLYQVPEGGGRFSEFVVLFDPAGVVSKTRRRGPAAPVAR